ncbi:head GIN domain-containing protein [Hymenobacter algoricola]|uniref:Head GIN domain-containing protein n=1 Tax=Hymenobacter algoricola TaxID=486267 RepID=A0ABP7N5G2_9BACT
MKNAARALLLGAAILSTSAAQAQQVKQTRPVPTFQAVHAGGGIDVFLTQGPTAAVVVDAPAQAQARIRATVQNGRLEVGWEPGFSWKKLAAGMSSKVSVYVTCPRLTDLSVSGGSDARGETPFTTDNLQLSASGGSDIRLTLTAKTLTSSASGGGDIYLTGKAGRQSVSVSGGSDYHAFALQSATTKVEASGGSDVEVSVDRELSSDASGGSGVRYKGNARLVKAHASGGSGVRRVQ